MSSSKIYNSINYFYLLLLTKFTDHIFYSPLAHKGSERLIESPRPMQQANAHSKTKFGEFEAQGPTASPSFIDQLHTAKVGRKCI